MSHLKLEITNLLLERNALEQKAQMKLNKAKELLQKLHTLDSNDNWYEHLGLDEETLEKIKPRSHAETGGAMF